MGFRGAIGKILDHAGPIDHPVRALKARGKLVSPLLVGHAAAPSAPMRRPFLPHGLGSSSLPEASLNGSQVLEVPGDGGVGGGQEQTQTRSGHHVTLDLQGQSLGVGGRDDRHVV
jgi:hypothetical protein